MHVDGTINNPKLGSKAWSVEVAFPLAHLVYNTSASLPPKNGSYWGINFSRVEWHVQVVNNSYVKVILVAAGAAGRGRAPPDLTWSSSHTTPRSPGAQRGRRQLGPGAHVRG